MAMTSFSTSAFQLNAEDYGSDGEINNGDISKVKAELMMGTVINLAT